MLTHYKAQLAGTTGLTTGATLTGGVFVFIEAFDNANPFWTAGGGLDTASFGNAVPTFDSNTIILRGGLLSMSVANPPGNTGNRKIRIQLVYPKQQFVQATSATTRTNVPLAAWIGAIGNTFSVDRTLQSFADYHQYLHLPVLDKEWILEVGDSAVLEYKLPIKKIDVDEWIRGATMYPLWIVYSQNVTSTAAEGVTLVDAYNVSFSVMPT